MVKIGILDIQGSVEEHLDALRRVGGVEAVLVKNIGDFEGLDGLIIPGGESTTVSKLLREYELDREIVSFGKRGGKIFGTCAGAILLASAIVDGSNGVDPLGLIDIDVKRNAYGGQLESFEGEVKVKFGDLRVSNGKKRRPAVVVVPAVFIRAPVISRVGAECSVLAEHEGAPVLVRAGNILVATFHPELGKDLSIYNWFFL